jgi:hypothetical protein
VSEQIDGSPAVQLFIPQEIRHPAEIWTMLDQVVGQNVRVKAHLLWHQIVQNEELHPTERTIGFVKVQAFLDYADEVDPGNKETTNWLLTHFGWKFPTTPEETNGSE